MHSETTSPKITTSQGSYFDHDLDDHDSNAQCNTEEVIYVDLTNDNDDTDDDPDDNKKFKTTIKIIKDDEKIPLVMDIPKPVITLVDLKNSVRFKGLYQYFYKQSIGGEECYRELISDSEMIPVFVDNIIEVKMFLCNNQQNS